MKKQLLTISNYLGTAWPVVILAMFVYLSFFKKDNHPNSFEEARKAELKALADKQDSVLVRIAEYDKALQSLAKERDMLQSVNNQLLQKQTTILNNIKNIQNDYSKIGKISLDRAAIYQFYIDSCKIYTPY